jgi:addiction module RelE/StbE family toxin
MNKLRFTKIARNDLRSILEYIGEQRPQTAEAVIDRLEKKCILLSEHPLLGQTVAGRPPEYRAFAVERWVIFYRALANGAEIQRVLDGAMYFGDAFEQ